MGSSRRNLQKTKRKKRGWIFSIILLAAVCIAGMELLVCRWADPLL